jgi:hypothetical protein
MPPATATVMLGIDGNVDLAVYSALSDLAIDQHIDRWRRHRHESSIR